ncbi:MAG: sortase [Bilifractor sp.]
MNTDKKPKKKIKKKTGWRIWLLTGLLLLAAALALVLYNIRESQLAGERSAEVLDLLEQQIPETPDCDVSDSEDSEKSIGDGNDSEESILKDRQMPTIEINGYRYIGYLECPSIGLRLPVMEDWDYSRLKIAPCRYSGSVYRNDLVIAGHNYARHFSPLRWQEIGTEIDFTDVDGIRYTYRISDIETISPTDIQDMVQDSSDWDLTLFTCTISGQARYTIRCVRTDTDS